MTPPKPKQTIPHPLLTDLLDPALSLPDIARRHDMPLPEVAQILESQAFAEAAAVVVEAAAVRARLLQPLLRQRALHATCRVMGQDTTSAARAESVRKAVNMILRWPDLPAQATAGQAPQPTDASASGSPNAGPVRAAPRAGTPAGATEPAHAATDPALDQTAPDIPPAHAPPLEDPGADIIHPLADFPGGLPPWAVQFAKARAAEWLGLKPTQGISSAHALAAALADAAGGPDPMDATIQPTPDSFAPT